MKRKTLPLLLVIFLVSGQTSWAVAQQAASSSSWSAVQQIGVNENLVVKTKAGKDVKGRMIDASETTLTIDRKGKPFGIPREEVRRVHVITGKAEKAKWALIGAGAGAAAGGGIGAIKYSPNVDDSELFIPVGMMLGTAAGAVTGTLFGRGKRKRVLVYSVN